MAYYTDHTLTDRAAPTSHAHAPAATQPRLAYLLSTYPAVSHTFFLREILALRARGFQIHTASVNPPDRAWEQLPAEEQQEAAATFYLKPPDASSLPGTSRNRALLARIAALLAATLAHPVLALRGIRLALALPRNATSVPLRLAYWAEAMLLGRWMRRHSLNHLHVHFGGPVATVALLTSALWRIPWSLTLHGPTEFHDQSTFWLREKILSATRIFAISDYTRSQILRIAPEAGDKTFVLRLGVQPALLQQPLPDKQASTLEIPPLLQILCTGRLVADKGQGILLRAFAALPSREHLRLVFLGDGPDRLALQAQAQALGIASAVEWAGALDHASTLRRLAHADLFVLASFAEGLPVALMEAMALGVPCISTYIAGIPELIASGENGLLVPAGNVAALAAAMQQMLDSPQLRQTLSARARETVAADYNLEKNLAPLAAHLTDLATAAEVARHG